MVFVAIGEFTSTSKTHLQAVFEADQRLRKRGGDLSAAKYFLVSNRKVVTVLDIDRPEKLNEALSRIPGIKWEVSPALDIGAAGGGGVMSCCPDMPAIDELINEFKKQGYGV